MYIILFIILLEGEESDKEDDSDDADKQMGDTDNAAEKYVYYILYNFNSCFYRCHRQIKIWSSNFVS